MISRGSSCVPAEKTIVIKFSGHGMLDLKGYANYFSGEMPNSKQSEINSLLYLYFFEYFNLRIASVFRYDLFFRCKIIICHNIR